MSSVMREYGGGFLRVALVVGLAVPLVILPLSSGGDYQRKQRERSHRNMKEEREVMERLQTARTTGKDPYKLLKDPTIYTSYTDYDGSEGHDYGFGDYSPTTYLFNDGQFILFNTVILGLTCIITGVGLEVFVGQFVVQFMHTEAGEVAWKGAQLAFPLLIAVAIYGGKDKSAFGLPLMVVGMYKFGFPDLSSKIAEAIFNSDDTLLSRVANCMDGCSLFIHHGVSCMWVCSLITGILYPDRAMLSVVLPLVVQHWLPLLKYYDQILYVSLEVVLEIWWELEAWSYIQTLPTFVRGLGFLMIIAHWGFFTSGALHMVDGILRGRSWEEWVAVQARVDDAWEDVMGSALEKYAATRRGTNGRRGSIASRIRKKSTGSRKQSNVVQSNEDLYRAMYDEYDADGNGHLDVDELEALLETIGHKMKRKDVQAMMDLADTSGNRQMEFEEFMYMMRRKEAGKGMSKPPGEKPVSKVQLAFQLFDRDGSGTIDISEFEDLLRALGIDDMTAPMEKAIAYQLTKVTFQEFDQILKDSELNPDCGDSNGDGDASPSERKGSAHKLQRMGVDASVSVNSTRSGQEEMTLDDTRLPSGLRVDRLGLHRFKGDEPLSMFEVLQSLAKGIGNKEVTQSVVIAVHVWFEELQINSESAETYKAPPSLLNDKITSLVKHIKQALQGNVDVTVTEWMNLRQDSVELGIHGNRRKPATLEKKDSFAMMKAMAHHNSIRLPKRLPSNASVKSAGSGGSSATNNRKSKRFSKKVQLNEIDSDDEEDGKSNTKMKEELARMQTFGMARK